MSKICPTCNRIAPHGLYSEWQGYMGPIKYEVDCGCKNPWPSVEVRNLKAQLEDSEAKFKSALAFVEYVSQEGCEDQYDGKEACPESFPCVPCQARRYLK